MKIVIDDKKCLKRKMTLTECFLALAVRTCQNVDEILANMLNRGIFEKQGDKYLITQQWSDALDEILTDSTGNLSDSRLDALAKAIQDCFPTGWKVDERGTKYYHRSNKAAIKIALKRFITFFGDYPDDVIIEATKRYVASFKGNYRYPFKMANYFVYKDNSKKGGEITSDLATFIENSDDEETEESDDLINDWEKYARN